MGKQDYSTITVPTGPILFIADLHLDSKFPIFTAEEVGETRNFLEELVVQSEISTLFVIGDIFSMQEINSWFIQDILKWLDGLAGEIIILPGNHDRNLGDIAKKNEIPHTTILSSGSAVFQRDGIPILFVTHDARGGYLSKVSKPAEFLSELRRILAVPQLCWLLAGHTHQPFIDFTMRAASIGPFNVVARELSPVKDLSYSYFLAAPHCCFNRYGGQLIVQKHRSGKLVSQSYAIEFGGEENDV
ncbi:MAG TPA: metallophosphoesterase [Candidatus Lokiarchaeia archaeon]|nr:metallophosphoesterase [Candidatus Lokiarchaeia archaeon]